MKMIQAIRILVLTICTLLFWGAWYLFPSLFESGRFSSLVAVGAIIWTADLFFLRKLSELSSLDGLNNSERERLLEKLENLRRRVWWTGGIGSFCSAVIWILVSSELAKQSPFNAAAVGFFVGVSLSYLVLIPFWFNEVQRFIERVNHDKATRASQEAEIGKLTSSK